MSSRVLLLVLPLGAVFSTACGRTVNDYLREAQSGSPEAISDAVENISDRLAQKEIAAVPFDEGDRAALDYLEKVARESDVPRNRSAAIGGLGRLKSVDSPEIFLAALEDDFWLVRMKAATALGQRASEKEVPRIVERFRSEKRKEVRIEMIKTLRQIGGELAIQALFETFLRRGDEDSLAWWALRALTGLPYSIQDRSDWQAAYDARFGPGEKAGEAGEAKVR